MTDVLNGVATIGTIASWTTRGYGGRGGNRRDQAMWETSLFMARPASTRHRSTRDAREISADHDTEGTPSTGG